MPELTVSFYAYNSEKTLEDALNSVLRQEKVEYEIIIINDGSTDGTQNKIDKFKDKRVSLIKNKERRGYYYCQNLVIQSSNAPFIVHVDSDNLILDRLAFRKLLNKIKESPSIGQVHCYYLNIDRDGYISRDRVTWAWRNSHKNITTDIDYHRELMIRGNIINHLRTYRKDIFDVVGIFNDKLNKSEGDWEMAVRLLDSHEIKLVPEFLCAKRSSNVTVGKTSYSKMKKSLNNRRSKIRNLKNKAKYYSFFSRYNIYYLYLQGIYRVYKINYFDPGKTIRSLSNSSTTFFKNLFRIVSQNFYKFLISNFSWWPIEFISNKKNINNGDLRESKIAYYLMEYPVFSQTFIQREIKALQESAVQLTVFSDIMTGGVNILDEKVRNMVTNTVYLEPMDKIKLKKYKMNFLVRNPIKYLNLFLYVVFHKYERDKSYKKDKEIFENAIYLAVLLRDYDINHIHSPWANKHAFIALIASKLAGISYSVEARAYDLNRYDQAFAHTEKFSNAKFIITNSLYNKNKIQNYLNKNSTDKIKLVYEGLSIDNALKLQNTERPNEQTNILCVARFIEEKGLEFLLYACSKLKSKGYSFNCSMIGGLSTNQNIAYYTKLKVLHKQLGLADCVFLYNAMPFEEVLKYYENSDFFVLPCRISKKHGGRDITPNVIFEAMSFGLPVISTNITAIPEIIDNDIDGLLVLPEDENALVDAIIRLINDGNLRKTLGENARKKIEEKFDINKNIKQFVELFSNVA